MLIVAFNVCTIMTEILSAFKILRSTAWLIFRDTVELIIKYTLCFRKKQ